MRKPLYKGHGMYKSKGLYKAPDGDSVITLLTNENGEVLTNENGTPLRVVHK